MPKYSSTIAPLERDDDTPAMRSFANWAKELRLWYIRPAKYQVKIGDVNYYPDRGTIHVDGESRASERYLDGLEKVLKRKNLLTYTRPKLQLHPRDIK
jgi:hypothetical protein